MAIGNCVRETPLTDWVQWPIPCPSSAPPPDCALRPEYRTMLLLRGKMKLEPRKVPLTFIVVDSVEKMPTQN